MTKPTRTASGRIFLSYRREETGYAAGWLYDRLNERFSNGQVFKDVDSIKLGEDFIDAIAAAVESCDVLLALIGDRWLTITGPDGRRRLDAPEDFVRLEIETALTRDVRVIPILVAGAKMPDAADLPPNLASLVRRQALDLRPNHFKADLGLLLEELNSTLAGTQTKAAWEMEDWFRPETGSQPRRTGSETAQRHSNPSSPPTGVHAHTTEHDRDTSTRTALPTTSRPSQQSATIGGAGSRRATWSTEIRTALQAPWYRRLIRYGRFWFGLLLILAGCIPIFQDVPYRIGYESRWQNVPNLHVYINEGLWALILLGALLLLSALISALRAVSAPKRRIR